MRHKISFLLGLLVGAALIEMFARGRRSKREESHDPRTEELRRRLADQRARPPEQAPVPSGAKSPSPAPIAAPAAARPDSTEGHDLAADRQRIYEQGRAAVDEMRRSAEPAE